MSSPPNVANAAAAPDPLNDPAAHGLAAGDLDALFLPSFGMLGASLRHRGRQLLRRVDNLAAAARKGSTAGIPLLHPWANRLAALRYAAAGREVTLDAASPLLHLDTHGQPNHGVPWSQLHWTVTSATPTRIDAALDWCAPHLLAIFPYPHRLALSASLDPTSLTIETTMTAGPASPVPISFGFHPYLGIPGEPRAGWRLTLPAMRRLTLDPRSIPAGHTEPFAPTDAPLASQSFDHGFALPTDSAQMSISGRDLRLTIHFLRGYTHAQVFAPPAEDLIALEPMTAPANALVSGQALRLLAPSQSFTAAFRIEVHPTRPP